MRRLILTFVAALMAAVVGGTYVAVHAPAAPPEKKPRKTDIQVIIPLFVVPDVYALVPGSVMDTSQAPALGSSKVTEVSYEFAATLFGATVKLQGSNDNVNWLDLTTAKNDGSANIIDVAIAVSTSAALILNPAVLAGAAGLEFRYIRAMAKNTVGASVANITGQAFAQ